MLGHAPGVSTVVVPPNTTPVDKAVTIVFAILLLKVSMFAFKLAPHAATQPAAPAQTAQALSSVSRIAELVRIHPTCVKRAPIVFSEKQKDREDVPQVGNWR